MLRRQREPLQQELHLQHARHADGWPPDRAALLVVRLDERRKARIWHHSVWHHEEPLSPGLALLGGRLGTSETRLLYGGIFTADAAAGYRGEP